MFSPKGLVYNLPNQEHGGAYHGNSQVPFASRPESEAGRLMPVVYARCFVGMFRFPPFTG